MSIEAHGKVARSIIFSTNRWGQYVKIFSPMRYTNTEAQKKVRHAYGQIGQLWRSMTPEEKRTYHAKAMANGISDFNQFFKEKWADFYIAEYSSILGRAILNKNYLGFSGY